MTSQRKNKVVLGLSGGVDSTAAALLLMKKGLEVTGLYFDMKKSKDTSDGLARARKTASQLGIKLIYRDLSGDFEKKVIDYFCHEYSAGRTPNPCIICNPEIKFKVLTEAADDINAAYIATGHYAGTYYDSNRGKWYIRRALNIAKDQSYMLYRLEQDIISRLLMPLNDIDDKEKVRNIVRSRELFNAEYKDSQEICFLDDNTNYKDFIKSRGFSTSEGDFIDTQGNVVGRHSGILNYTIGQRKGLGITLGKPVFVTGIHADENRVYLGDNEELFSSTVISHNNVLVRPLEKNEEFEAKIRYGARPAKGIVAEITGDKIVFKFNVPQRAITPGQSIVFYKDNLVVGGGFTT